MEGRTCCSGQLERVLISGTGSMHVQRRMMETYNLFQEIETCKGKYLKLIDTKSSGWRAQVIFVWKASNIESARQGIDSGAIPEDEPASLAVDPSDGCW